MRLLQIMLIIILGGLLASCGLAYKYSITQGNLLTSQQIQQLHPGQTRVEVIALLGDPILQNTFNDDRLEYVYSVKAPDGTVTNRQLSLLFQNNRLVRVINQYGY